MKKVLKGIFIIVFLLGGFLIFRGYHFLNFSNPKDFILEIERGISLGKISHKLETYGGVPSAQEFKIMAYILRQQTQIQAGQYEISQGMRPYGILKRIVSGDSLLYPITFQEGLNIYEMKKILEAKGFEAHKDFLTTVKDKRLIRKLLKEDLDSLEGYLFPETYRFGKAIKAREIVEIMVKRFLEAWEKASKQPAFPMPRHQAVIFASIIEKETGYGQERALISSVFHNRLRRKMKLQSDPTILYGILDQTGIYKKNIRRKDIRSHTPYNTYTVKALPKGPISNPGEDSLYASMNPATSEYLFFVSRNDGTHVFTKNYKDHLRAVKKFQLNRRSREGKSWRDLKKKKTP